MRRIAVAALALLLLGVASGCGDESPRASTPTSAPTATHAGAPSTCAAVQAAGTLEVDAGSLDTEPRTALVHVPKQLVGASGTAPVVFGFHGYGQTADNFVDTSLLVKTADAAGFVLVAPQGYLDEWHFRGYGATSFVQADLEFIDALLDRVAALDCVNPARIVVSGGSMGGGMADFLACRRAGRFAAAMLGSAEHLKRPCRPSRPIPIVSVHGLQDPILPYWGGDIPSTLLTVIPVERAMKDWAAYDGCHGAPRVERLPRHAERLTWRGCAAPVVHYRLASNVHGWFLVADGDAVDINGLIAALVAHS